MRLTVRADVLEGVGDLLHRVQGMFSGVMTINIIFHVCSSHLEVVRVGVELRLVVGSLFGYKCVCVGCVCGGCVYVCVCGMCIAVCACVVYVIYRVCVSVTFRLTMYDPNMAVTITQIAITALS